MIIVEIHIVDIMVMIQKHSERIKVQMPPPFKFKINKTFVSLSFRHHKFKFHVYDKYLSNHRVIKVMLGNTFTIGF